MKLSELSPRRRQIVELLAQGKSNKEIANYLHISIATVNQLIFRTSDAIGVHSRTELVAHFFDLTPRE